MGLVFFWGGGGVCTTITGAWENMIAQSHTQFAVIPNNEVLKAYSILESKLNDLITI